jgi:hypothetical protein
MFRLVLKVGALQQQYMVPDQDLIGRNGVSLLHRIFSFDQRSKKARTKNPRLLQI